MLITSWEIADHMMVSEKIGYDAEDTWLGRPADRHRCGGRQGYPP